MDWNALLDRLLLRTDRPVRPPKGYRAVGSVRTETDPAPGQLRAMRDTAHGLVIDPYLRDDMEPVSMPTDKTGGLIEFMTTRAKRG